MNGPFRFVFSVLWLAIALSTLGTLRECTLSMAGMADTSVRHDVLSLSKLNHSLLDRERCLH